jgi:hypothetical protein
MQFEVVTAPVERGVRAWKYLQIPDLQIGEGLKLPWAHLPDGDPCGTIRTIAWLYGKRLPGRKFRTQKHPWGMLLVRIA